MSPTPDATFHPAAPRVSDRTLEWLVPLLLVVHNIEEGIAVPHYRARTEKLLSSFSPHLAESMPSDAEFFWVLTVVSVVPFLLVFFATRGARARWKELVAPAIQAIVFINVFVPHLPAAILLGGYAPGVATAVLINLPFSIWFFRRWKARCSRVGQAFQSAPRSAD